jgi:hypothetical protein
MESRKFRLQAEARLAVVAIAALLCCGTVGANPSCDRVVAVGNLDGGYEEFVSILQRTDLIGEDLRWGGGTDCLVQVGDIDDHSPDILEFLTELKPQAPERIFVLIDSPRFVKINDTVFVHGGPGSSEIATVLATLGSTRMVLAPGAADDPLIKSRFGGSVFLVNAGASPNDEEHPRALVIGWTGKIEAIYADRVELMVEAFQNDGPIEEFLLNGEIVKSEEIGAGLSGSQKLWLEYRGETMKAAFKTIDTVLTGRVEIKGKPARAGFTDRAVYERAAYLLDRFLGLNKVPVTVMRTIDKKEGAVIHWVSDAISELERREQNLIPPDPEALKQQTTLMHVFDLLIANEDRNQGNMLFTTEDWKLHLIDHTRSFRMTRQLPERFLDAFVPVPRGFYERLRAIDQDSMNTLLEGVLSKSRTKALIARRNRLIKKFEGDIQDWGSESVFLERSPPETDAD